MGQPSDLELNPDYVRSILNVINEQPREVAEFICPQFTIKFVLPVPAEGKADAASTPAVGFVAGGKDDDEEDEEDEGDVRAALHRRALGLRGTLPSLTPIVEPPDPTKD